jgi:putative chitobiose transport system permease protein
MMHLSARPRRRAVRGRGAPEKRNAPGKYSIPRTAGAIVAAVLFGLPILWVLESSFRTNTDIFASLSPLSFRLFIPQRFTLEHYVSLFGGGFGPAIINSLVVAALSVVVGLVLTSTSAYALAALDFPGKRAAFAVIVVGFMVPFEAIAIPLYQVFVSWNLDNTYIALILPGIANGLAVFNLRQAFLELPPSLREAARMDGASEWTVYRRLYLPLARPALINSGILIFLAQWAAYLWPLLIATNPQLQLAPVNLASSFGEHIFDYGQTFAGIVIIAFIPAAILISLRKFFITTNANAGVKG